MNLDDRFADDYCVTCGVLIVMGDDAKVRHNNWHEEMEKIIDVFEDYKLKS